MADPAVLEEGLAVVGGHDDDGLVAEPRGLEVAHERAHLLVGEGQVAVVEALEVLALLRGEGPPALVHLGDPGLLAPGRLGDGPVRARTRVEGRLRIVREVRLAKMEVEEEAAVLVPGQPVGHDLPEHVARGCPGRGTPRGTRRSPRSKPKAEPATALATKPAVWTPRAVSISARVSRSLGRRAENETSLWCRSGYCDVQTDDMAPRV